jgi:hypothetical protein
MMRPVSAVLGLVAAFLLCLPAAVGAGFPRALVRGATGSVAQTVASVPAQRYSKFSLNPGPGDLELMEVEFPRRPRESISASTLGVRVHGLFGDDYLAAATPRRRPHGELVALVLLVNRPSALADPASVQLVLRSRRTLQTPYALRLRNPFSGRLKPRIIAVKVPSELPCQVPRAAAGSLQASDLRQLGAARGAALPGFSATAAIAAAFDVICEASYPSAFRLAVQGTSAPGCGSEATQQGRLCCPPNAICAPAPDPAPPGPGGPKEPGCPPCSPRPRFACPLAARPAIWPADAPAARRLAAAGSH